MTTTMTNAAAKRAVCAALIDCGVQAQAAAFDVICADAQAARGEQLQPRSERIIAAYRAACSAGSRDLRTVALESLRGIDADNCD